MATVTFNLYDLFRKRQIAGSGQVDLAGVTLKVMLVTAAYTVNQNTHDFVNDLGATEVTGTNYTAGGKTLANVAVTMDGSGNVKVDADDPAAPYAAQNATGFTNARRAILYNARGGASSADELIGFSADFGVDGSNVLADFPLIINVAGLFVGAR